MSKFVVDSVNFFFSYVVDVLFYLLPGTFKWNEFAHDRLTVSNKIFSNILKRKLNY